MLRVPAMLDIVDGVQQQLARGNDRFIGGNQMLRGPVLNGALAFGGKCVMRLEVESETRIGFAFSLTRGPAGNDWRGCGSDGNPRPAQLGSC